MLETEWEEQDPEPLVVSKRQYSCSGSLSKCVALALVVAVSMGFGHFYGEYGLCVGGTWGCGWAVCLVPAHKGRIWLCLLPLEGGSAAAVS